MTNWFAMLQSAFTQGCAVAITERRQSGRQSWDTYHAARRIVALTADQVTLDDHTRVPLRAITCVRMEAAREERTPFVGRTGHLRYTVVERFPVDGGAG